MLAATASFASPPWCFWFLMSSELNQLIQLGHDITATKYFMLANCTILFYDYLLTLGDEIKHAWSGKKTWTFWLFFTVLSDAVPVLAARELVIGPVTYAGKYIDYRLQNKRPLLRISTWKCNNSVWYIIFVFVVCTLLAQVVLTLRIYAVAKKNIRIAAGFAVVTGSQFALGVYMLALGIMEGAQAVSQIPLDSYSGVCVFVLHKDLLLAYTIISIVYDTLAFSLMVFLTKKSESSGLRVLGILRTITEDTVRYFLVIFTIHFILVMTLTLGRESIQLLPGTGIVVYLPVMISRIMLSLRKAADSQQEGWSLGEPSGFQSKKFFRFLRGRDRVEAEIPLSTYPKL